MQIELRLIVTLPDSMSLPRQSIASAFEEIIGNGIHDADDDLTHNDSDQGRIFEALSTGYHNTTPPTISYTVE
jgi:hypothetical protein